MKLNNQVTVAAVATRICHSKEERTSLTIFNAGDETIFIGSDNQVTEDNGFPIPSGMGYSFLIGLGDDPRVSHWGIVAADTEDCRWWEAFVPEEFIRRSLTEQ